MTRRRLVPPAPELLALGSAIRHLRRERELSQEALAYAADIHPKHLSEIERANKDPRSTTVVRLADALGVPVAELYEAATGNHRRSPRRAPDGGATARS